MSATEFKDLVRRCREAQKDYFRNRDTNSLEESKRLEREIDRELESDGQQELFEKKVTRPKIDTTGLPF